MSNSPVALDLSVLLLPVGGRLLIVPSAVVEEIIKRRTLAPLSSEPPGVLGTFPWHNARVAAMSFEALNQDAVPDVAAGSRLVIMNTLGDAEQRRHYAILTQGVPHLLRLTPGDVSQIDDAVTGPAELMRVQVHGQLAAIPDLEYIERRVPATDA